MSSFKTSCMEFWRDWRKHVPALLFITAAVLLLEAFHVLYPVESMGIDRFVRVYKTPISQEIFLVEITDKDYRDKFGNHSPLDAKVLETLLTRISNAKPKVIGVDLDTTETPLPKFRDDPTFIWAEVPDVEQQLGNGTHEASQLFLAPVIGNLCNPKSQDPCDPKRIALPQFPQDDDGIVRRFEDSYWILDGRERMKVNSMPCALSARYAGKQCADPEQDEKRFSMTGDHFQFQKIDATEILSKAPQADGPLHNQIVLVGGDYRAARDTYITPAGELAGMEVIANATQSYLKGGRAIREASLTAAGAFDLGTGTFVIWLFWRFESKPKKAFWLSITIAPFIAMVVSLAIFGIFDMWLGFAPVIIGMIIHMLYDYVKKLEREVNEENHGERSELIISETKVSKVTTKLVRRQ